MDGSKRCSKCGKIIYYNKNNIFWDEKGYGYSAQLIQCSECGHIIPVCFCEDKSLDINNNKDFYKYN